MLERIVIAMKKSRYLISILNKVVLAIFAIIIIIILYTALTGDTTYINLGKNLLLR
jgi:hypothetical protein